MFQQGKLIIVLHCRGMMKLAKMCTFEAWVANMKSVCDTLVLSFPPLGFQERGSSESVKPGCKFPSILSHGCVY